MFPSQKDDFRQLGKLGQMVNQAGLLDWNSPRSSEIRTCLLKLFSWQNELRRQARQKKQRLAETDLP